MNPLLEVNPDACIVVVGPRVSSKCLHVIPESLKLSYSSLIQSGLEMVRSDERGQLEDLYQTNIDEAAEEIIRLLTSSGHIDAWIASNAGTPCNCIHRQSPLLQLLLKMQSQGCRLVYTHYDNILDVAAGMIPILPINDDHLEQWISGKLKGFLHLHGHYSDPDSLILYSSAYDSVLSSLNLFTRLKDFFNRRTVIFIGHTNNQLNPLLVKLTSTFLCNESDTIRNPPLFISSMAPPIPLCFLHLPVTAMEEENFHLFMSPGPETSFVIGRSSDKQVDKEIIRSQAVLIFSEKQSFRKLGDIIYQLNQSGEIYVRRDALTILFDSKIMYGNILTYGGCGLRRIWELSVPPGSVLRGKGLIALGLQNSLMIWINKKPVNLGQITEVNTFHSLWNNSAAAMKSQPHATPTCSSSSPITSPCPSSYSPVTTPTVTNTTTWSPLLTMSQPPTAAPVTPVNLPYSAFSSYRPLFPILPPPLIPVDRTLVSPVAQPRPTVIANLPYQIYGGNSMGLQAHTPSTAAMCEPLQSRPNDPPVSESMVTTGNGMVDVDNSREGSLLSEEEGTSAAVCLVAEPPILLQEVILENLKQCEHQITSELNGRTTIGQSSSTDPRQTLPVSLAMLHPSPLSLITTPSSIVTGTNPSTPLLVAAQPTQVQPHLPIVPTAGGSTVLRPPMASLLSLVQPFPLVGGLPSTPLQYPSFAISPYSFFPSLIQQGKQPEYVIKLLQSNALATSSNTVTPPTLVPSVASNNTVLIPRMPSTVGQASLLLPHQLEGTSNQHTTNLSDTESDNEISGMSGTSRRGSGVGRDGDNDHEDCDDRSDSRAMHLWEFILHLLLTPNHGNLIQWTGDNYEFTIIDPEGLTTAWCGVANTNDRNFNTILGTLRSYSGLGILEPVQDKKLTYTFVMDIQRYMSLYGQTLFNFRKDD